MFNPGRLPSEREITPFRPMFCKFLVYHISYGSLLSRPLTPSGVSELLGIMNVKRNKCIRRDDYWSIRLRSKEGRCGT